MTRLDASTLGRLQEPLPVTTFPYVDSIEVEDATFDPDEPSPCFPTAVSVWYGSLRRGRAGSCSISPGARRSTRSSASTGGRGASPLVFLGCASPVWNAQLSLEASRERGRVPARPGRHLGVARGAPRRPRRAPRVKRPLAAR